MIAELLAAAGDSLIERTSSTLRVQNIVQLSLAPVFMLAAIGAVLNVMNMRLTWIVERVDKLEKREEEGRTDREIEELPALRRRQKYAHDAINLSTGAGLLICVVIILLFVSAFIRTAIGTWVAATWITAMVLVSGALLMFLLETRLATRSAREMRSLSRRIERRERD
ncbi:DUF2721 domain-containing protein [Alteriqipengyuania sp. WL0013]|uniref:DUF2721 domain-containing protein n=1 Tax=Alteriqipengyuania sp. WL0013 TaxID=3110773 RepID=UPI002BA149D4|nr:DUF2721 domain-containing protein [Alteriqipengyuania sp. WL0013]MEB3416566.1 DUF2721 domain-containing protein [Alteriqipengyuania sp. WL0013]